VRLWDLSGLSSGSLVDDPIILPHDAVRFALAFSPDRKRLASGGDRSLSVWSCEPRGPELLARREGTTYRCLAFSPDGSTLALGRDDGSVVLLDSDTVEGRAVLLGHRDVVRSVAFSPDGSLLVSSGQDRQIMLWDAKRGTRIRSLGRAGTSPVQLVAFSPRGNEVAVGEFSGGAEGIVLIDPATGDIRCSLAGHHTGVTALAYSPDGQTLATAGVDRTIKFWNIKDGKERATLIEGVGCVRSISFSPNGEWLAYAGSDLTIKLWHVSGERTLVVGRCPLKV
jgi:WD40 repeat protein